MRYGIFIMR